MILLNLHLLSLYKIYVYFHIMPKYRVIEMHHQLWLQASYLLQLLDMTLEHLQANE